MPALLCTLLSAAGFWFSLGLQDHGWLAWIAPVPVLWVVCGPISQRKAWLYAWSAMALGRGSQLIAYGEVLSPAVLALSIAGPALLFCVSALMARRMLRAAGPVAALFTFATFWTATDFLAAFNQAGGSISTPAAAEAGIPALMQIAALVGFSGITFLLGAVSAGIALSLRTGRLLPAGIAVALFFANAAYGHLRMTPAATGTMRVSLIESDAETGSIRADDKAAALKAVDAYTLAINSLAGSRSHLIVLPEDIAHLAPEWRTEVQNRLAAAAAASHSILVAGFNTQTDGALRNVSLAFTPGATVPVIYAKRHLMPGFEKHTFTPGSSPRMLPEGIGLEICKDMDTHYMVRRDATSLHPLLFAVPAWDFDLDAWAHARIAVLRSVENGVPLARTARNGLLMLTDRYGRIIAMDRTKPGFSVLTADVPVYGRGGDTLYDLIGDLFGWLCVAVAAACALFLLIRRSVRVPLPAVQPLRA